MDGIQTLKIQSITDVITNSSSETYMCIDSQTVETVKNLLQELVKTFDPEMDFNSMFTIVPEIYEADVEDMWESSYANHYLNGGTNLSIEEKAYIINDDICDSKEGSPVIYGLEVKANNPWNNNLAEILNKLINSPIESATFYT